MTALLVLHSWAGNWAYCTTGVLTTGAPVVGVGSGGACGVGSGRVRRFGQRRVVLVIS